MFHRNRFSVVHFAQPAHLEGRAPGEVERERRDRPALCAGISSELPSFHVDVGSGADRRPASGLAPQRMVDAPRPHSLGVTRAAVPAARALGRSAGRAIPGSVESAGHRFCFSDVPQETTSKRRRKASKRSSRAPGAARDPKSREATWPYPENFAGKFHQSEKFRVCKLRQRGEVHARRTACDCGTRRIQHAKRQARFAERTARGLW